MAPKARPKRKRSGPSTGGRNYVRKTPISERKYLINTHPDIYAELLAADDNEDENFALIRTGTDKQYYFKCRHHTGCGEHVWCTTVNSRTATGGTGCPYCIAKGGKKKFCSCSTLKEEFPNMYRELDAKLNPGIRINQIRSTDFETELTFKCHVHTTCNKHVWRATAGQRTRKRDGRDRKDFDLDQFGDAKDVKDVKDVKSDTKMDMKDAKDVKDAKSAVKKNDKERRQKDCPYCSDPATKYCECTKHKTLASRPDLVAQMHPEWNDDLDPSQIALNSNMPVIWVCPNHTTCQDHVWSAFVSTRVRSGSGCPYCSTPPKETCECQAARLFKSHDLFAEVNVEKTLETDHEMKARLYELMNGSPSKVWWNCSDKQAGHPPWPARISSRTKQKSGCPKCADRHKSELWKSCRDVLDGLKLEYETEYSYPDCKNIYVLKFDFYVPSLNLLIEVDGVQHFQKGWGNDDVDKEERLKRSRHRDQIKNRYTLKEQIPLLRISYNRVQGMKSIVTKCVARIQSTIKNKSKLVKKDDLQEFIGADYKTPEYIKLCL